MTFSFEQAAAAKAFRIGPDDTNYFAMLFDGEKDAIDNAGCLAPCWTARTMNSVSVTSKKVMFEYGMMAIGRSQANLVCQGAQRHAHDLYSVAALPPVCFR